MKTAYVRGQGRSPDGVVAEISWKAWVPPEQTVASVKWDQVRVCLTLEVGGPGKLPFHKWWQLKRPSVCALWTDLGVNDTEHIPSLRSGQGGSEEARDVPTLSSKALAYFLLHCTESLRGRQDRARAFAALFGWLARCVPTSSMSLHQWVDETFSKEGVWRTCASASATTHQCPHMVAVLKDGFNDSDRHLALVRLMQHLYQARDACPIIKEALQVVTRHAVEEVDANVEEVAYTCDPTKADGYEEAGKKRRRIDADYKKASTSSVLESGRASSSSTFLRADAVVEGKRASEWEEKELLRVQSSMWFAAGSRPIDVVVLAADAGRFGQPAEDTLVAACDVSGVDSTFACWLPPQVTGKQAWENRPFVFPSLSGKQACDKFPLCVSISVRQICLGQTPLCVSISFRQIG